MPALLYCRTGPMAGASFSLDAEATVGRTAENSVRLSDDRVSSRHARIWPDPDSGQWMIEDLDSSNGTHVDGFNAGEPVELGDLSVITFAGRFDFIFQVVASAAVAAPAVRASDAPAAAGSAAAPDAAGDVETRAGGAPPSLPHTGASGGDEDVRTKVGGAAPSLPDVGATDDATEDVRTRIGGDAPSLPDVDSGAEEVRTRLGGAAPDLPETGDSKSDDGTRTRAGGAPPSLPNVSDPTETIGPGEGAKTPDGSASRPDREASVTLKLHSSEKSDADSEFALAPGEHIVGRSSDCDVRIDDASLSRRHAVITVGDGRVTIRDEGSKNGTYVDGERVTGERAISPENRLRFGFRMEAWISDNQGP